ncbi:hypothetical protein [Cellulomonas biazotea]|uniref:DUF4232 domain-containing protein n=1 Tax=Cellulomonas biazotea TaxID=1709 RepID=A0A402DQK0_9CELL|nr:hypothetical protein [Cellulomonas biazotea]GCE76366.1 hypothetical protein CBZ_14220 [Cellulomonas biazotea]
MGVVRPSGPLPARVYWVRRTIVLGLPLLVVALVVWVLVGRGAAGASADGELPPASETSPAGTDATTPAGDEGADAGEEQDDASSDQPANCAPEVLALAITATAESFPAGVSPTFAVSITNTGSEPCLVDAGEAQREVVITSGVDRVWSSRDCVAAGTEERTLLLGGGVVDETPLVWNRERSAQGCPAGQPEPGAGTYSAAFTLAGATATPAVFGLG